MNIKQYISLIKAFFDKHSLINTVESGNQFNFNASSKIKYPVAHAEYIVQGNKSKTKTYSFLITIADIFDPNLPGSEEDIYSDTNEIADDFFSYFGNQYDGLYTLVDTSTNIQKFTNGNIDRVCGCVFTATFQEDRTADECIIPLNI